MKKDRCIIIPAIKKNAVIPDQLVKKLAGTTLIQRALDTAKQVLPGEDIFVVTDSEEISLIAGRNEVQYHYDKNLRFGSADIIKELKFFIEQKARDYRHIIIYRASAPLVDHHDVEKGYELFLENRADILVTIKRQQHCIWQEENGHLDHLIFNEETEPILIDIKAFLIFRSKVVGGDRGANKVVPYFLDDKAIEITSYQNWWICEKLLKQKKILFVVAGYPAIGLGHVYRALTLAHEITDHRINFLCTNKSELAIKRVAEKEYPTELQSGELLEDVLRSKPDLVINDMLDTDPQYIQALKDQGIKVVNFEDSGPGAELADLVINALYSPEAEPAPNHLYGPGYFCLRDEFDQVRRRKFSPEVKNLLITFGGTDPRDFTRQTLETVLDECRTRGIFIYIVTGPGYLYRENLEAYLEELDYPRVQYIHQTGIMSSIMEKADAAISSAGRTVYELAHMRIPSIVMSQHPREATHQFACPDSGFENIGLMDPFAPPRLLAAFGRILDTGHRQRLHQNMKKHRFDKNKKKVIDRMQSLLDAET